MPREKSPHGDGGIRKRRGGYEARIWIDGRRVSRWARTEREAKRALGALRQTRASGGTAENERITVAEYLAQWLESIKPNVAPRSYDRFEQQVRVHLTPALGRRRLADLRPAQVQQWYRTWGERLSPTTVRHLHACLRLALGQAVRWEIVGRNVALLVKPPSAQKYEAATLTHDQLWQLLTAARDERLEALYVLALTTGMREGELLGLKWDAVELIAQRLTVRTQLSYPKGGPRLAPPKTKHGRRIIPLTSVAVGALTRWRARQAEERLAAGTTWEDRGLVFATPTGGFLVPQILIRSQFHPLLERAGLPRIRFHDLRHTVATLLHHDGVEPRLVADLLGHGQVSVTLDTYTHAAPDQLARIRADLEAHFADLGADGANMGPPAADGSETA